jgi:glycosyltransferase involved in cell wall biosynthesis
MSGIIKKRPLVSVILPTFDRYEIAVQNVDNILKQDYDNFEIIVCDDSNLDYLKDNIKVRDVLIGRKIKYFYTALFDHEKNKTYGLAAARNTGVINANGEILVFLDDRITPDKPDMISIFVNKIEEAKGEKVWFFGDKGAHKTAFVENCSAIKRQHIIDAGMFCERITKYGGMTRELFCRFSRQGFKFVYVPEALATALTKSKDRERKEKESVEMKELLRRMGV